MVDAAQTSSGSSEARFYAEQARREQAAAGAATLDNVRDKHQRSASAWSLLAGRASARDAGRAPKADQDPVVDAPASADRVA